MARHVVELHAVGKRYLLGQDYGASRTLREALSLSIRRFGHPRSAREHIWSLKDVSFSLAEGDAVGIIGRNGAGKSTLLKVLTGITDPTEGVVRIRGRVGSLLEVGTGFHPELTGRENVYLSGAILGMSRRSIQRRFDEIIEFSGVERFLNTPIKRYSSGMYLRLAFAVAAHLDADILLVDEVLAVGDAEFQRKCLGRMAQIERDGRTVVFVSHDLDAVVRLCPTCIWLDAGRVVAHGSTSELVDTYLASSVKPVKSQVFDEKPEIPVWLRTVSVLNPKGRATSVLRREEPVTIEVEFAVRAPVRGLDVSAYVQNFRGLRILDEAWSETQDRLVEPGEYRAHLTIPPVLNIGDYIVGVWLGTVYEDFAWVDEAATFHLQGGVKGRGNRVVQLRLRWDVQRLGVREAPCQ